MVPGRLADEINHRHGTTLTREYVARWERGKVAPAGFYVAALSGVLDVPLAVLEDPMVRREFLTDVAGTAIAPVIASDLLARGFAARLAGGPSVEAWEAKLSAYGTQYMSMGAADIQRRVAGELVVIQQQPDQPRLWSAAARLMTLYAKTFPGSDGVAAVRWYRMAASAADESAAPGTRVRVRRRAAIALGYEGASLGVADALADQAPALADGRPSLGLLNAIYGKAHAAALRGDRRTAQALDARGRRVFDAVGSYEQTSDYAVPWWRLNVFRSLPWPASAHLPSFATHRELHRELMLARSGDRSGGVAHATAAMGALPPEKHSLTLCMLLNEIRA
ncbi:helix-turn-helix domain-containing protein [Streptomyces roseus]|uniref:helix-turn-helix domain-containing protein n=1 Tax=Streptomyces roseus TaxID=66430 RepID=UPI0038002111